VETRRRGWAGSLQGALVIHGPAFLQTVLPAVSLDVAWCGRADSGGTRLEVRRIAALRPYRLALPRVRSGCVVVANPGSFDRWQLRVGDHLEIREV
jgi:hypothetical protein